MKKIYIPILTAVAIWTALVCFDSVRLLNAHRSTKPVFVLAEKVREAKTEKKITYYGPGYSVAYGFPKGGGFSVAEDTDANLGEFRLFGLILIWAWIA